jgi:hypothetical protein
MKIIKNPKLLVVLVIAFSLAVFTSCTKEDDVTATVTQTYVGFFNTTAGFSSTDYKVTVTKVDNTTVKITPEDENGTEFEVAVSLGENGAVNGAIGQVVFAEDGNGKMVLAYNNEGEAFGGTEQ